MTKSPIKEMYIKQLAEKAKLANCFIYNPRKTISINTNRLEVGEKALTHTGWGLNEREVWLEFYCVDKSKTAIHAAENIKRFQKLFAHRVEIEKAFGEGLIWDFDPLRTKQSVISRATIEATEDNQPKWGQIQDDLIARTIRLGLVLKPFLVT